MNNIFSINFRTASYDVGADGRISVAALFRYFQEAAHEHANSLGVGFHKLRRQNIFWVLSATQIEIGNLPGFDEEITVNTWPRGVNKFFSLRDFQLYHKNQIAAKATSLWLLIDVNSKRIVRPERIIEGVDFFSDERVFTYDFTAIEPLVEKTLLEERRTRFCDLDINNHVNNIKYVEWILDAVYDFAGIKPVKGFKIQYLSEFTINEKAFIYRDLLNIENEVKIEINHTDDKTGIRALIGF